MPLIIGALVSFLFQAARTYLPGIIGRCLLALGIGLATSKLAMPAIKSAVMSYLPGLGPAAAYWDASGAGIAFTMILSAIAAQMTQRAFLTKLTKD